MVDLLTLAAACVLHADENLTIYSLVPPEAKQGWKLELFKLGRSIEPHYHRLQRQYILVAEGKLNALYGEKAPIGLESGELAYVDPGIVHSLTPEGTAYFFSIDFPGFHFPEDVFYDQPLSSLSWTPQNMELLPPLDPKYFGMKIDAGNYGVYELVSGRSTGEKWSIALLEIQDSPKHFHRIEREIFVVVNGELDIEVDGMHQILKIGESITLLPNQVHKLISHGQELVRVLCFSFPAFNPTDMYCVD